MEEDPVHDEKPYRPTISPFYAVLENAIAHRYEGTLSFRNDDGMLQEISARIMDLYTDQGIDYVRLDNHQVIPLDQISRVDMHDPAVGPSDGQPDTAGRSGTLP